MQTIFTFFLAFLLTHSAFAQGNAGQIIPGQFIVSLDIDEDPRQVAREHGIEPRYVYDRVLKGFAGPMSEAARSGLLRDARVRRVEQDRVVRAIDLDRSLAPTSAWGLDRIDQRALPLNGDYSPPANGSGVRVYVIDTGIRYDHAEFGGRASFGYDAFGGNGSDCNGHGTHVAGTVGGSTYGVAKNASLIAVRVLDCNGSGSISGVIAGVDWVALNRSVPAVANLSLGGGASSSLDSAISNLIANGVTTVVAAGNSTADACTTSPARVPAAITIGATDTNDARASFSNYGSCLDLFAPGVNIPAAYYTSSTAVAQLSGTSMASPHVAGAAALYLAGAPLASPEEVRNALYSQSTKAIVTNSASANNHLLYTGGGTGTNPTPTPPPTNTDVTAPSVSVTQPANGTVVARRSTVTIAASATDNVGVRQVEFYVNGNLICTDTAAAYSCNWNVPNSPRRTYSITARAYDAAGNVATSAAVSVQSN